MGKPTEYEEGEKGREGPGRGVNQRANWGVLRLADINTYSSLTND